MIDKEKKVLFIHIPKCAGSFISNNLTPGKAWNKKNGQHDTLRKALNRYKRENLSEYYIFSVVRNPFERFASFFYYHQRLKFKPFKYPSIIFSSPKRKDYMKDLGAFIHSINQFPTKISTWAKNDLLPSTSYLQNDTALEIQVFKLEEIDSWLPELESKTHSRFSKEKLNAGKSNESYESHFGPREKEFVFKNYQSDFNEFYPDLLQ